MTDDPRTICKRCGFANVPGDQFCGSCGAFLEWEGQPADASAAGADPSGAAPPATPDPAVAAAAGAAPASAAWGAPYGDPIPNPVRPAEPEPDTYDEDGDGVPDGPLVRCPACGIANPSNRTFCQSCGTTLAAAARVEEPEPEKVAAAVAWTPTPPPSPVTRAPMSARGRPSGALGIPPIAGIAVVGLLVGVAIVLAGLALRGSPPETAAGPSDAPSSAAAGSATPGSSASAAAASPGAAAALTLTATASSVLGDLPRYAAGKAIDGDPKTSWQEGKAQEKNQWIEVAFDSARADTLVIRNGAQASAAQYNGNRRPKDVIVKVGGKSIPFRLKDTMKAQQIDLGGVTGATSLRITIVSTYAGQATTAPNTPSDNAAVSEVSVLGVPGG